MDNSGITEVSMERLPVFADDLSVARRTTRTVQ
jgi:hypothetical protein